MTRQGGYLVVAMAPASRCHSLAEGSFSFRAVSRSEIERLYRNLIICLIQVSDMNTKHVFALITAVHLPVATAQAADSYQCSMGDQQRRVEILSEPGTSVPCEVHYYKDANAPDDKEVLWRANNQEGYCESQTEAFIAKLQGWGWDCGQGGQATSAPDAGTGDAAQGARR